MNKLNTIKIIAISAFVLFTFAGTTFADYQSGYNYTYNTYQAPKFDNPMPIISSIVPNSSALGVGSKNVTITGEGFIPSSVARINGNNQPTTFIDNSHLLFQVTGNDTQKYFHDGGFFITVVNGLPGGGYSNTAFFTIGDNVNNFSDTNTNQNSGDKNSKNQNIDDVAANALFGSNGVFPSGIIQWLCLAILVLLAVIWIRRLYGADKRYHDKPMKHD